MPQLSRALASEPLLAAHLLGPLCAVISGHRSTRLHQEIPALRKPSSSSSRKSPLTARYQPLVYSRIVGKPYLGIISGLPFISGQFFESHPQIGVADKLYSLPVGFLLQEEGAPLPAAILTGQRRRAKPR